MDIFSQRKLLIRLVILLTVLNILLLVFLAWHAGLFSPGKPPPRKEDLASLLKKELQLSGQQTADFKKIRDNFFEEEKKLSDSIREKRDSMNLLMFSQNADDSLLNTYASSVATAEHRMELLRIQQAKQLRAICNKEQLTRFEHLVNEIRDFLKPESNH
ncbi:MAG: periplasmic heavy metal sensor [Ferruginibacter sp.]